MSTITRLRLATLALVCLLVWPPVHHVLVRSFDMDPWAYGGFAMYAVPNLRINVRAAVVDDTLDAAPDWNAIPADMRGAIRAYALERARWGELLPPDALADEILARESSLPGIVVRVRRWELDRSSARIRYRDHDYRYTPPGR